MLRAESLVGNVTIEHSLPWWMTGSFILLWGTTFLVPRRGCASIQMRQRARVQPGHAEYMGFLLPAASEVGMVLRCLCYGSKQCLFEVWSLGRRPKRTWAGLVWISKSKLKIYSSVWKIPDPNLHMDLKKIQTPMFLRCLHLRTRGFILKKENKSNVKKLNKLTLVRQLLS